MNRSFLLFLCMTVFIVILISCGSNDSDTELFGGGLSRDTTDPDVQRPYISDPLSDTFVLTRVKKRFLPTAFSFRQRQTTVTERSMKY